MKSLEVSVSEVAEALKEGKIRLIDVRTEMEHQIARITGAELLTQEKAKEMTAWPKDTSIVFLCHHGMRSLEAASFFARQGFTDVRSMTGGIDAWSVEIDSSVPRY